MSDEVENQEYQGPSTVGNAFAKGALVGQLAVIPQLMGRQGLAKLVALGGLVGGGVWGWNQADKAEKQFDALKENTKDLRIENEKLKADTKWTERMESRSIEREEHGNSR